MLKYKIKSKLGYWQLKNNKVYVGYTTKKPEERIKEHNQGSNLWSKLNKPLKLIYYENYICAEDAKLREKFFKMGFGKDRRSGSLW